MVILYTCNNNAFLLLLHYYLLITSKVVNEDEIKNCAINRATMDMALLPFIPSFNCGSSTCSSTASAAGTSLIPKHTTKTKIMFKHAHKTAGVVNELNTKREKPHTFKPLTALAPELVATLALEIA